MEIDNSIKEDYCSFKIGKLLKKKGWNSPVLEKYLNFKGEEFIRPTHSLALKWLRDNFNIHIEVRIMPASNIHGLRKKGFEKIYQYWIQNLNQQRWSDGETCSPEYNTYKEATEAALLYVLKELI